MNASLRKFPIEIIGECSNILIIEAMSSAWRRLSLPNADASRPPLLIKHDLGASDYSVWITDLTFVWSESLDRKHIIQRSFAVDTSIDPSEGPDQLRLFLRSLGDALEQRPGTSLVLVQNDRSQELLLQTCTPLPGSLRPLNWFIELNLAPPSRLTAELIVPLLHQQVTAQSEKESLLQHLKEKDQVITKLVDKLQSDGNDLGRLFPGVAPSKPGRQTSRQALAKSVKGLGEFNEGPWRQRLLTKADASRGYIGLVTDAFEHDLADLPNEISIPHENKWWERLRHKESQDQEPRPGPELIGEEETSTQNEFQVGFRLTLIC